jgi:hypothetical protein
VQWETAWACRGDIPMPDRRLVPLVSFILRSAYLWRGHRSDGHFIHKLTPSSRTYCPVRVLNPIVTAPSFGT